MTGLATLPPGLVDALAVALTALQDAPDHPNPRVMPTGDALILAAVVGIAGLCFGVILARLSPRYPDYCLVGYSGVRDPEDVADRYRDVRDDDLLDGNDATVQENAPRALQQVHLKAERDALRWVLADGYVDDDDRLQTEVLTQRVDAADAPDEWVDAVARDLDRSAGDRVRDMLRLPGRAGDPWADGRVVVGVDGDVTDDETDPDAADGDRP